MEINYLFNTRNLPIFCIIWLATLSIFAGMPGATQAQDKPQVPDKLLVGVADFPPYAMKGEDGKWEGFSIELWQAVAKKLAVEFELKEFNRVKQVVEAIQTGKLDLTPFMAVTEYHETVMDLSHSFHRSGLAVAVPQDGSGYHWIGFVKRLAAEETLRVVLLLLLLALLAGTIIWLLENKKNRDMFDEKFSKGIGHGIWWAMVTMTTVGYGDKAPRTVGGRVVAVVWMFFSIILVTSYTAAITASFTVDELNGRVRGPRDLPTARVGALTQSETLEYLVKNNIPVLPSQTVRQGLQAVVENQIDAFVDNEAQLRYVVKNQFQGKLRVLSETFAHVFMSMALPTDSPLREPLDRTLAKIINSDEWIELKNRYLGGNH